MSPQPSRIYLVDDHPLVREWLTALIHQQADLVVCGEAESVAAAARGIARTRPHVAIIDLSLEDGGGLGLLKHLALRHPDVRIIVLSMHDETLYAERVLRAGARGYIMKRETTKNIIAAIRRVLDGAVHLSEAMQALFAKKFIGPSSPAALAPIERLSDRELEIFHALGQGQTTRRIAGSIGLSVKTVHSYYARIREKLRLANASELLREAVRWNDRDVQA